MALAHPLAIQALVLLGLVAAAVPASAVQIAFFGGSNIGNLQTVVGDDGIGDNGGAAAVPLPASMLLLLTGVAPMLIGKKRLSMSASA